MAPKKNTRINRKTAFGFLVVLSAAGMALQAGVARQQIGEHRVRQSSARPAPTPRQPSYYDQPEVYDLAAIRANPAAYYSRVVPSRVWQIAPLPPGESTPQDIMKLGPGFRFVLAGGEKGLPIAVRAQPERPVTFTVLDQGHFANGQNSITVPADADGYARVDFWVGEVGDFRVLVGSPENRGPAEFVFQTLSAEELHDLESGAYAVEYLATVAEAKRARKPALPVPAAAAQPTK